MSRSTARVAVVAMSAGAFNPLPSDWRLERMAHLVEEVPLSSEWDAEHLLVIPRPGGLLAPGRACPAPGCPNLVHRGGPLCQSHEASFVHSELADIEDWLASSGPGVVRPRFFEEHCVVEADGECCHRPGEGALCLCKAHSMQWANWQRAGEGWEAFFSRARPLGDLGGCVAASCYLAARYKQSRLCDVHYAAWRIRRYPSGRRFETFLAQAPQPGNRRILSLRGLPELVRREMLYAIGCRVREQIRTRTTEMRPYVDRLLASGVDSLIQLNPGQLEPSGRNERGRFARYAVDRVCLAYGDPETERDKDLWDLRLFERSGHLDFSGIRQDWLRHAVFVAALQGIEQLETHEPIQGGEGELVSAETGHLRSDPGRQLLGAKSDPASAPAQTRRVHGAQTCSARLLPRTGCHQTGIQALERDGACQEVLEGDARSARLLPDPVVCRAQAVGRSVARTAGDRTSIAKEREERPSAGLAVEGLVTQSLICLCVPTAVAACVMATGQPST